MKKITREIFTGLYYWQSEKWGSDNLPAFTALLLLSAMQFVNISCVLMIVQSISKYDIFGYFSSHLIIGMIIPVLILTGDYLLVQPIKSTVTQSYSKPQTKAFLYGLITIAILVGCVIMIIKTT